MIQSLFLISPVLNPEQMGATLNWPSSVTIQLFVYPGQSNFTLYGPIEGLSVDSELPIVASFITEPTFSLLPGVVYTDSDLRRMIIGNRTIFLNQPGTYIASVSKDGYRTERSKNIIIRPGQHESILLKFFLDDGKPITNIVEVDFSDSDYEFGISGDILKQSVFAKIFGLEEKDITFDTGKGYVQYPSNDARLVYEEGGEVVAGGTVLISTSDEKRVEGFFEETFWEVDLFFLDESTGVLYTRPNRNILFKIFDFIIGIEWTLAIEYGLQIFGSPNSFDKFIQESVLRNLWFDSNGDMFTLQKIESSFLGGVGSHYSMVPIERNSVVQDFLREYQLIRVVTGGKQTSIFGVINEIITNTSNWFQNRIIGAFGGGGGGAR